MDLFQDQDNPDETKFWQYPQDEEYKIAYKAMQQFYVIKQKQVDGLKQFSSMSDSIEITLILEEEKLYLMNNNEIEESISGYVDLIYVYYQQFQKFDQTNQRYNYFFSLSKNKSNFVFFTPDLETYQSWSVLLEERTIKRNFLSEYIQLNSIGKGGFSKVFNCMKKSTRENFAAKIIDQVLIMKNEDEKEQLINEVRILRRLRGVPRCLQIQQIFESKTNVYIITELFTEGDLYHHLNKKRKLDFFQIAKLVLNIAIGIQSFKDKGVIHRDIKLENILVSNEDSSDIVIADFGLAICLDEKRKIQNSGTPGYIAPQVFSWRRDSPEYTYKYDIFALGVMLYILISGEHPFPGQEKKEILEKNKIGTVTFQNKIFKEIPPQSFDLLKQMIDKDPNKRISIEQCMDHRFFKIKSDIYQMVIEFNDYKTKQQQNNSKDQILYINSISNFSMDSRSRSSCGNIKNNEAKNKIYRSGQIKHSLPINPVKYESDEIQFDDVSQSKSLRDFSQFNASQKSSYQYQIPEDVESIELDMISKKYQSHDYNTPKHQNSNNKNHNNYSDDQQFEDVGEEENQLSDTDIPNESMPADQKHILMSLNSYYDIAHQHKEDINFLIRSHIVQQPKLQNFIYDQLGFNQSKFVNQITQKL